MSHFFGECFNTPARRILAISLVGTMVLAYFAPDEVVTVEAEDRHAEPVGRIAISKPRSMDAEGVLLRRTWALPSRVPIADAAARPFGTPRPKPVVIVAAPPPKPLPPPKPVVTAPPLPFQFVGLIRLGDGPTMAQLLADNRIVSAASGQQINVQYMLENIEEKQIAFRYLPNNQMQYLRMGRD